MFSFVFHPLLVSLTAPHQRGWDASSLLSEGSGSPSAGSAFAARGRDGGSNGVVLI